MIRVGGGGGGGRVEERKRNHLKQQTGVERGMKQRQRHFKSQAFCTPPLPASKRSVL